MPGENDGASVVAVFSSRKLPNLFPMVDLTDDLSILAWEPFLVSLVSTLLIGV